MSDNAVEPMSEVEVRLGRSLRRASETARRSIDAIALAQELAAGRGRRSGLSFPAVTFRRRTFGLLAPALILVALLVALLAAAAFVGRPQMPRSYHLGRLAYAVGEDVYVAEWNGDKPVRVTDSNGTGVSYGNPRWAGSLLVFSGWSESFEQSGPVEYRADSAGLDVRRMATFAQSMSPDGHSALVLRRQTLEILRLNTPPLVVPVPVGYSIWDESDLASSSWSPDASVVLVGACTADPCFKDDLSSGTDDHDLFAVPVDGSAPVQLSTHDSPAWNAMFSTDGSLIAFNSHPLAGSTSAYLHAFELGVMRADGTHRRELVGSVHCCTSFAWSPDSRRLALSYQQDSSGVRHSVILDAVEDGHPPIDLPDELYVLDGWSPDGDMILAQAFVPDVGSTNLMEVHADGSTSSVLVHGPQVAPGNSGNSIEAAWEWVPDRP
jgi:hypothetical protein